MPESLGAMLRSARMADRLSLQEAAKRLGGVGSPHLSKVERGIENPSDDLLYKLANLYEISGDLLVLYAGRIPPRFVRQLTADPVKALDLLSGAAAGATTPEGCTCGPIASDGRYDDPACPHHGATTPDIDWERMYLTVQKRFEDVCMSVWSKVAEGGSLGEVVDLVGEWMDGCDCVDDESVALMRRAMDAAALTTATATPSLDTAAEAGATTVAPPPASCRTCNGKGVVPATGQGGDGFDWCPDCAGSSPAGTPQAEEDET